LLKGYLIPFKENPGPYEERNNKSARDKMTDVRKIVAKMIEQGVVRVTKKKPTCVSPLGLVERVQEDGSVKQRLIWDASRHVNLFIQDQHVRLSHLNKALEITQPGDWQAVFDYPMRIITSKSMKVSTSF